MRVRDDRRSSVTRRRLLALLGAGVPAALLGRPVLHLTKAWQADSGPPLPDPPPGTADDASRLSSTKVAEVVTPSGEPAAIEATLREALVRARREKRPVAIAGARHTMGGQTSLTDAVIIDTRHMASLRLLEGQGGAPDLLEAGAGARWHDVLRFLDPLGRAVQIMQSNDAFSVGGSMGANAHGWQPHRPPLASTVESFRLMVASGEVLRCNRTENAELFALVMGGYGLFGVVLDARLRIAKNVLLEGERHRIAVADFPRVFADRATDAELAYGRLRIAPSHFLEEALLTVYRRPSGGGSSPLPPVAARTATPLARALFRGEVESDYGKELRWSLESTLGGEAGATATRNQIMSEPVGLFQGRRPEITDILHEYFVPVTAFAPFVATLRETLRRFPCDLLNVTVRHVLEDRDAFLRYARGEVFALVLLFAQRRTPEGEAAMTALTRALVDAVATHGGTYYLPYRLHATRDQLRRLYPMADAFFAKKRAYDPGLLFRNHFWETYA